LEAILRCGGCNAREMVDFVEFRTAVGPFKVWVVGSWTVCIQNQNGMVLHLDGQLTILWVGNGILIWRLYLFADRVTWMWLWRSDANVLESKWWLPVDVARWWWWAQEFMTNIVEEKVVVGSNPSVWRLVQWLLVESCALAWFACELGSRGRASNAKIILVRRYFVFVSIRCQIRACLFSIWRLKEMRCCYRFGGDF